MGGEESVHLQRETGSVCVPACSCVRGIVEGSQGFQRKIIQVLCYLLFFPTSFPSSCLSESELTRIAACEYSAAVLLLSASVCVVSNRELCHMVQQAEFTWTDITWYSLILIRELRVVRAMRMTQTSYVVGCKNQNNDLQKTASLVESFGFDQFLHERRNCYFNNMHLKRPEVRLKAFNKE